LKRNRWILFVLAALIALTAASAHGAFAPACRAPGTEAGAPSFRLPNVRPGLFDKERQYISALRVREQRPLPADETEPGDAEKVIFDCRNLPAPEERMLCAPKVFAADRFLREKSPEPAAKPAAAAAEIPSGVLSEFEPPVILLLPTRIAVRK
jgi:hypothetical protein